MKKFAILSIPKKIDVPIEEVVFHVIDEITEYLEKNNASLIDYQVLTSRPDAVVYRLFCKLEFHRAPRMTGMNHDDI